MIYQFMDYLYYFRGRPKEKYHYLKVYLTRKVIFRIFNLGQGYLTHFRDLGVDTSVDVCGWVKDTGNMIEFRSRNDR